MARDSSGSKNEPIYIGTGAPADAADLSELGSVAAFFGNHKVGPATGTATGPGSANTGRTTSTGADIWNGLLWSDTTDNVTYKYVSGSWVAVAQPLQTSSVTAASGYSTPSTNYLSKRLGMATVMVQVVKSSGNLTSGATIATVPAGYLPTAQFVCVATSTNSGGQSTAGVLFDTSGNIAINWLGSPSATLLWIVATYPTTL